MLPPPSPPPIPSTPAATVRSYYYVIKQICGALLCAIGVGVSVLGLHGMTIHGGRGRAMRCTKSRTWVAYAALWAVGQVLQLLAVLLAEEPVVAAVCNVAVIVNAYLAHRLLGEPITKTDMVAIVAMTVGACLVVAFVPAQQESLSTHEFLLLFDRSALPVIGFASTTLLAVVATPRALQSAWGPVASEHQAAGSASGGLAFGLLAGWSGATSMTAAKVCTLFFDHYAWDALTLPLAWAISVVSFTTEIGMVVFVIQGMARHEASVVVPTYYISMTLIASAQGICLFGGHETLTPLSATGFGLGVMLCTISVGVMAGMRKPGQAGTRRVDRAQLLDGRSVDAVHCSVVESSAVERSAVQPTESIAMPPTHAPSRSGSHVVAPHADLASLRIPQPFRAVAPAPSDGRSAVFVSPVRPVARTAPP